MTLWIALLFSLDNITQAILDLDDIPFEIDSFGTIHFT